MEVFTPQVLWHGGGQTNGKTERVYSVDIHPIGILVTSGIDGSSPAKGCVRLMTMTDPSKEKWGSESSFLPLSKRKYPKYRKLPNYAHVNRRNGIASL